jgi:N-acetylglucosaminyl-diphospho-decaprenol L-rhamnosyltransferase
MQPKSSASAVPDVTISIVSLNTRDLLSDCLRSVSSSVGVTFEVRVVDNGSSDGSPEMVARDYPKVELIRGQINRGFAAANNIAIRNTESRYVLLLNPDTVVEPYTLCQMIAFMDSQPDVGICGPRILFPDGRFQSCGYRFPTLLSEIRQSKNVGSIIRWIIGEPPRLVIEQAPADVDWVDGACFLIRRTVIQEIGLLDEQYFLYAEELDWCFRARQAKWRICALPSIRMVHYQGQSSAQMSDFSLALLIETRLRYYRKNHGLGIAVATSLVYVAGCLKQWNGNRHKETVKLRATLRWWRSLLAA